ncbi:MAG: hypothetical protein ACD_37C00642G0003 [uncultured bacterium]|nr:MAG: hypothetical protein ACD_37C00642G0003 [uncultured bacterium]
MQLGKIQLSILALIIANVIWGASFPIYKWSLDNIPPFTFAFLRFYLGALIILPFVLRKLNIAREDIKELVIVSIFSVSLQIPLLFFGLKLSPSINAPIIIAAGPIFLIMASIIFLKEKPGMKVLGGTLISLIGVLMIILRPLLESGLSGGILGNLLIFLATICGVIQAIFLKRLTPKNDPLTLTFWMFLIGSLPLIPFIIIESNSFNIWQDLNLQGLIGLSYGVILASVFAHFFLAYAIKYVKASEVGIFTYVDPIATIVIAVPLLHETISSAYAVAAVFVFVGILIAEGRLSYHPLNKLRG